MRRGMRAVIFDLDGTLLDTIADIAHAMNKVLAARDLPEHEIDAYRSMVGWGLKELARRALPEGYPALNAVVEELHRAYHAEPGARASVYPGVRELLAALVSGGIPTSVLSNKSDDLVSVIVSTFFPTHEFSVVQGLRTDVPPKPDPTSARSVLSLMHVDPGEAIYLGDSEVDVQTAEASGMISVGAAWGFRGREELEAAGAPRVIDHPNELVAIIDEEERQ